MLRSYENAELRPITVVEPGGQRAFYCAVETGWNWLQLLNTIILLFYRCIDSNYSQGRVATAGKLRSRHRIVVRKQHNDARIGSIVSSSYRNLKAPVSCARLRGPEGRKGNAAR